MDALERRLGLREVRAGGEDDGEVDLAPCSSAATLAAASMAPVRGSEAVDKPHAMRTVMDR